MLNLDSSNDQIIPRPSGFPEEMKEKPELISLVTKIIFQSSVMHAAVNFMQFEYGIFAPNNPACMRGTLPTEEDRGKVEIDRIIDSLPDLTLAAIQAGAAYTLSDFSEDEVFLFDRKYFIDGGVPQYPPRWLFTEVEVEDAYKKFYEKLAAIEAKIDDRNLKLKENNQIPYYVLKPSRIPYGIAI